jgi:hypothetical protein
MTLRVYVLRASILLCFALLGLIAQGAATAQAAGEWLVSGARFTQLETFTGSLEAGEQATFLIHDLDLILTCTSADVKEAEILSTDSLHATLLYLGCNTTTDAKKESIPCTVEDPSGIASHLKFKTKGLIILHSGKTYVLLLPLSGTEFGSINFSGAKCPLPEENGVTGGFVFEVGASAVNLLLKPVANPGPLFGHQVKVFGTRVVLPSGALVASLTGANTGSVWGAI